MPIVKTRFSRTCFKCHNKFTTLTRKHRCCLKCMSKATRIRFIMQVKQEQLLRQQQVLLPISK